ncbi:adhesion G-protein coupled receptor G7-like [Sardina pilchardus]|uniref:adhesion G-protein coupled receptor G7-like n=1 Tax=Sardina pilchardus TaxID=27697 RepID=UPI002E10AF97
MHPVIDVGSLFSEGDDLGIHKHDLRPADHTNATNKVLHDFACVFWDYNISDWSDVGCHKYSSELSSLTCGCYHTTNLAVLMSFKKKAKALNLISIVGFVLSIPVLSITLVYQIMTRKSRRNAPTVLLVCLCTSMIIYNLTFVAGISNPHATPEQGNDWNNGENNAGNLIIHDPDKGLCTLVTVLLQYFLLATFSFNTLYAADLLMMLKRRSGHFTRIYMIVGWGFPAVMVALSLAVSYRVDNPLGYRRHEACWLAATDDEGNFDFKKPMLWGFLVPVSAMLLFNAYVLMYFAYLSFRQPFLNSSKNAALKKKLLSSLSLGVVLGLSWFLGYLVLASTSSDGLYILLNLAFSVLVSMQGVQIFILFKARSTLFRRTTNHAVKSILEISKGKNSRTTKIVCESRM